MFATGRFCSIDSEQCYYRTALSAGNGDENALLWGKLHPSFWTNKLLYLL